MMHPPDDAAPSQHGASANCSNDSTNPSPNLIEALRLAALGWHMFPCHTAVIAPDGPPRCSCGNLKCEHVGKHPRTAHGLNDATTDLAVIRTWWDHWPDANVAVRTGPESGIVVLDQDPRSGGTDTLAELQARHGNLPPTVQAQTGGGGAHYLFGHPGRYIKSRNLAPGLDCKGDGGYIIVEPSRHASGHRYAWELSSRPGEVVLAAVPPWLLEMMTAEPARTVAAEPASGSGPIRESQRNTTLTSLAGSMRRRGMSEPAILAALLQENSARSVPPLPNEEVGRIARSVARYQPAGTEPWRPPAPLFDVIAAPPFPLKDAFPPGLVHLRDYCEGLAYQLQVPVDLTAMTLLPVVATAIAQKFVIELRDGWRETTPIWCLGLLDSGERKSGTIRRMTDPVLEWERDEAIRLAPEIAAANEERELLDGERKECRKKGQRGDRESRTRAIELAKQLAGTKELTPPSLVLTDATSEALVSMMLANGERALVASPEADALDVLMGRYDDKARPNMGVWLKAYTGDRVRVYRRNRPAEFLERPHLSIALAVQPEAVRGLFGSRAAHGRGLLARFFGYVPTGMVGRRIVGAPPVNELLEMAYVTSVRRLLDLPLEPESGPRVIRLAPESLGMFTEFEVQVEKELARGGGLGDQRAWGAKLCGGIARVALAYHCLEVFGGRSARSDYEVAPATMRAALSLAPYLIEHERLASSIAGCQPDVTVADRVLTWLERSAQTVFTRRDCFTKCRGAFLQLAEELDRPLRLLEDLGYIRPLGVDQAESKVGRPRSATYEVNPTWGRGGPR